MYIYYNYCALVNRCLMLATALEYCLYTFYNYLYMKILVIFQVCKLYVRHIVCFLYKFKLLLTSNLRT